MLTITPDYRQFITEVLPVTLLGLATIFFIAMLPKSAYLDVAMAVMAFLVILKMFLIYATLTSYSWEIGNEKIRRIHGILTKQTDYIELYRVVDYRETQTLLQRILGIKTVSIISTDKSDQIMLIKGVPAKTDLVSYTRNLVEQNKKQRHVYEIANR